MINNLRVSGPKKIVSSQDKFILLLNVDESKSSCFQWSNSYLQIEDVQVRLLSEKLSDQPESHSDKEKMAEFSVPTWMVSKHAYHKS